MTRPVATAPAYGHHRIRMLPSEPDPELTFRAPVQQWQLKLAPGVRVFVQLDGTRVAWWRVEGIEHLSKWTAVDGLHQKAANDAARAIAGLAEILRKSA